MDWIFKKSISLCVCYNTYTISRNKPTLFTLGAYLTVLGRQTQPKRYHTPFPIPIHLIQVSSTISKHSNVEWGRDRKLPFLAGRHIGLLAFLWLHCMPAILFLSQQAFPMHGRLIGTCAFSASGIELASRILPKRGPLHGILQVADRQFHSASQLPALLSSLFQRDFKNISTRGFRE